MSTYLVTIDRQSFCLEDQEAVDRLKTEILAAVTAEPAFVEFVSTDRGAISILISPLTSVLFTVDEGNPNGTTEWLDTNWETDLISF